MATQTPNIGLTLPIGTEHLSRSIVNNNNTIIDTKMGAVGGTDLQTQVNNLSSGKVNTSDIANNLTTTAAGKVLDARQGKALSDQIGGAIPQNTNLDSFLKQGVYRSPLTISGVATLTNCPTDIPFTFIISGDGTIGGTVQTVLTQGHIYTRRASSTAWGSWYDFVGTVVH